MDTAQTPNGQQWLETNMVRMGKRSYRESHSYQDLSGAYRESEPYRDFQGFSETYRETDSYRDCDF